MIEFSCALLNIEMILSSMLDFFFFLPSLLGLCDIEGGLSFPFWSAFVRVNAFQIPYLMLVFIILWMF